MENHTDGLLAAQDEQIEALRAAINDQTIAAQQQARADMERTEAERQRIVVLQIISRKLDRIVNEIHVITREIMTIRGVLHGTGDLSARIDVIIAFISASAARLGGGAEVTRLNYLLEKAILGGKTMPDVEFNVSTSGGPVGQAAVGDISGDVTMNVASKVATTDEFIQEVKNLIDASIKSDNWGPTEDAINGLSTDTLNTVIAAITQGSLAGLVSGARVMLKLVRGKYRFMPKGK